MATITVDMESYYFAKVGDVLFDDDAMTVSSLVTQDDGLPCFRVEFIDDRKAYFKRKLEGK